MSNLPLPLIEPIGDFVGSRRDMERFTHANRDMRQNMGCNVGCPAGHKCYPASNGCILGETRPGRPHCCQFDNTNADVRFLKAVLAMQRVASFDRGRTYQGPASDGFVHDLGELIPANINTDLSFFPEIQNRGKTFVTLDLTEGNIGLLAGAVPIPMPMVLDLVSLGMKLFRGMYMHLRNNFGGIYDIGPSIRGNPFFFIESQHDSPSFIPRVDALSAARNIKISGPRPNISPVSLTEQRLFDMILEKLENADDVACRIVINCKYVNAGQALFGPIQEACTRTRFKGYILCRMAQGTSVTQGTFNGVSVSVSPVHAIFPSNESEEPPDFIRFTPMTNSPFVLHISRVQ